MVDQWLQCRAHAQPSRASGSGVSSNSEATGDLETARHCLCLRSPDRPSGGLAVIDTLAGSGCPFCFARRSAGSETGVAGHTRAPPRQNLHSAATWGIISQRYTSAPPATPPSLSRIRRCAHPGSSKGMGVKIREAGGGWIDCPQSSAPSHRDPASAPGRMAAIPKGQFPERHVWQHIQRYTK